MKLCAFNTRRPISLNHAEFIDTYVKGALDCCSLNGSYATEAVMM